MAAQRLIAGDLLKTRFELGAKAARLDATFNLAIEKPDETNSLTVTRGNKLGTIVTRELAMLMRKFGGWTYEENCSTLE